MLRIKLLRLDRTEQILLLTMHHIISDGWSLGILMRELSVLYGAFKSGNPSPLPHYRFNTPTLRCGNGSGSVAI
ncbi:MAG: hypothetical protein HC784_04930 [Hydrococcus sp. CSU_1_8]|nr:hypothetical protein [Hydrococcus sp. CSU_1_8]